MAGYATAPAVQWSVSADTGPVLEDMLESLWELGLGGT